MATQPNTTAAATPEAEAPKVKTVLEDMESRRLFDSSDEAAAYLGKCAEDFPDFGSYPVAATGLTEDGEFDPEVYNESMQIAVAVLTKRGEGPNSSTVKAIVIYPSPKPSALMDSATGADWIAGLVAKEANHVAVRQLRKAESDDDIAEAIQTMPTTLDDYTTSGRESSGGVLETYNSLWQTVKKGIGEKAKTFRLANLSKKELRKAMESASYASAMYPALEDRTNKKGDKESFFVIAATYGEALAKQQGLDPAFFERALALRDEKEIALADDADADDFDFEAMAAAVSAKAAPESTDDAATETPENNESEDAAS